MVSAENVQRVELISSLLSELLTSETRIILVAMPQFDLIVDLLFHIVHRSACSSSSTVVVIVVVIVVVVLLTAVVVRSVLCCYLEWCRYKITKGIATRSLRSSQKNCGRHFSWMA